jgi:hypothetical protein
MTAASSPKPDQPGPATATTSPGSARGLRILAWLLVTVMMAQAALAGPAWFQEPSLFELHGWLGTLTLVLAAVAAVVAFIGRQPGWVFLVTAALFVGSFAQIGLGYAGRRGGLAIASSIHVPLGVALLGLAVMLGVALAPRRAPSATSAGASPSLSTQTAAHPTEPAADDPPREARD